MSSSENKEADGSSAEESGQFRNRGFKILGLSKQDLIRIFFGGNASVAIVVLVLICVFLAREAFMFFPDHHHDLKAYRQSGQEYVDFASDEIKAHTNLYSSLNIAYFAEVNRTAKTEDTILRAYRALMANLENVTAKTWGRFERDLDRLEDVEDDLSDAKEDLEELDPEAEDFAAKQQELNQEIESLSSEQSQLTTRVEELREKLKKEVDLVIDSEEVWNMGVGAEEPPAESKAKLREAVLLSASPEIDDEPEYITGLKAVSKEKKAKAAEELSDFKDTVKAMQASIRPLKSFQSELRSIASKNKSEIVSFSTAAGRKEAWEKGAQNAATEEERQRMAAEAEKVVIKEPDYAALNQPFYESLGKHAELIAPIEVEMAQLYAQIPSKKEVQTKSAKENLDRAAVFYERFENTVSKNREEIKEWRHDKPITVPESVTAFLFGRNWISNSSWHDFYGILPIFTGSFLISIIALTVAVPFAVSAAIYVNQLAPHREQNFIKPAIEFIEAIPSVVLGFFGILVFGETLRAVSQVEWLQWVPGFPMAERLTILNAGLLLAFMAIPTIFTLTEDALNNVPQAFTENSLAMGASKLQTVFRVVVPTAVSGVLAAILLGFGRIIGETMVVLLVAGNKIKIPDFTEGLGVIAQPAHTMTGIIAQELGEVDQGSLHWRALFMVGMVLFCISLLVNFAAQKVLKKLSKI
ncbi:MAG: phosphate ABC transporter permease subunit PstC [Verrucomicrobiales bacterium]|nr:phosphate ABC transporter permease subunit PstC [Verrucomicrobiales bacterium]